MQPRRVGLFEFKSALWVLITVAVLVGGTALGTGSAAAQETFACVAQDKLVQDIDASAKLVGLTCYFAKWDNARTLHFKVTVQNVSESDQRFRVNIFLENGKGVGGLLPRKTSKGLIKPGATASFVYPVGKMDQKPAGVTIRIAAMGQ